MAKSALFAANWKMHLGPADARAFARTFLDGFVPRPGAEYWFFPTAVSLEATAVGFEGHPAIRVGAQDVHWEPKGAYTGATSVPLAKAAGASLALVGHSERRHVFGETEVEAGRKVKAAVEGGLVPLLCVGEKLDQRESGVTEQVVLGQLRAGLGSLDGSALSQVVIAYEPVWAIGTGKTATPADAAQVHRAIRAELVIRGHPTPRILYGGSVNEGNAAALLGEREIDGLLVGGASLDPAGWQRIVSVG